MGFLSIGVTETTLIAVGIPSFKVLFMMFVKTGIVTLEHFFKSRVGIGSSPHVLGADFFRRLDTSFCLGLIGPEPFVM